jgi:uncharacterized protein
MYRAQVLYELQQTDSEIDRRSAKLQGIEAGLADTIALDEANVVAKERREAVAAVKSRLKTIEWEVEDFDRRIATQDKKLYDGSIKNPKELSSLQHEVNHLRELKRAAEDRELETLVELEEREGEQSSADAEVGRLEAERKSRVEELSMEKAEVEAVLAELQAKRASQVAVVDPADLPRYEKLRPQKKGQAVALVDKEVCKGCQMLVPFTTMKEARTGKDLVYCGTCGRILYVPRQGN